MTQREAWLYLAKLWSGPLSDCPCGGCGGKVAADLASGLCVSVDRIAMLPAKTREAMRVRIRRHREAIGGESYLWPTTEAGAKKRAAFCRRQAALLTKKRTSKKKKFKA